MTNIDEKTSVSSPFRKLKECKTIKALPKVTEQDMLPELLKRRLFLFPQRLVRASLRYVPCWQVYLDYSVRGISKNQKREGRVDMLVDEQRGCLAIDGGIILKPLDASVDKRLIVGDRLTEEQAEKKAVVEARWKVLMARYKQPPELTTTKIRKFYRPYYKATVFSLGKESEQWIPADGFDQYFTYQ
jgi:hypothetical protein